MGEEETAVFLDPSPAFVTFRAFPNNPADEEGRGEGRGIEPESQKNVQSRLFLLLTSEALTRYMLRSLPLYFPFLGRHPLSAHTCLGFCEEGLPEGMGLRGRGKSVGQKSWLRRGRIDGIAMYTNKKMGRTLQYFCRILQCTQ